MKNFFFIFLAALALACNLNEEPEKLLKEQTYLLHRATYNPTRGTATVTELGPGKIRITIELQNTTEGTEHPAHLHFGSIAEVGQLACKLNPVDGATGKSVTIIDQKLLSNGVILDYDLLMKMNGSIKVHLNDSYFKQMVLAYGNIGENENYLFDGVSTCTGH